MNSDIISFSFGKQSLGMSVEVLNAEQEKHEFDEGYIESIPKLGINLSGREMGDNK